MTFGQVHISDNLCEGLPKNGSLRHPSNILVSPVKHFLNVKLLLIVKSASAPDTENKPPFPSRIEGELI